MNAYTLRWIMFNLVILAFSPTVHAVNFYALDRTQQTLVMINSSTGNITTVGPTGIYVAVGGLSLSLDGDLYWLGAYQAEGSVPDGLLQVDKTTGNFSVIGSSYDFGLTMDGFAIIGDAGYTIRHEQSNTHAQLYAINLGDATPTKIGTGYTIDGSVREKTLGLTTDGVHLYGIRGNGVVERISLATGQIESVIGDFGPLDPGSMWFGPHLAYAENKFWSVGSGTTGKALYSLNPADGTVTLIQDNITIGLVDSLSTTSYPVICPDLVVDSITPVPPEPIEGQPVTLTVKVRNQGAINAGVFNLDWYADRIISPAYGENGDQRVMVASLPSGDTYLWNIDWVYDVSGDYTMAAQADTDNWIPECNEENNVLMTPLYVGETLGDDTDGDGILDEEDNCVEVPNTDQRDSDGDGYGNLCDGDLNNDGATNTLDLNLYKLTHRSSLGDPNYNANADFNGDGMINTLDLNIYKGLHRKPPGPSCCGAF